MGFSPKTFYLNQIKIKIKSNIIVHHLNHTVRTSDAVCQIILQKFIALQLSSNNMLY